MEYAIIKTGGKQYKASKDVVLEVERLAFEPGKDFNFEEVLMYVADGKVKLGNPTVKGMAVKATVLEHFRGEKLRIAKFKQKVKYRRVTGHRQALSKVKIIDILTAVKS